MIAILYWTIDRLVRKKAVCCGQGRINRKFLWKISQESLKSFFCILYSLDKEHFEVCLKNYRFLTSGHSEKCFWDFETNLKTFQKYKSLLIKSLRDRLLGVRIRCSPPFIFPLPISGKKRIFYSKALKVVGVKDNVRKMAHILKEGSWKRPVFWLIIVTKP